MEAKTDNHERDVEGGDVVSRRSFVSRGAVAAVAGGTGAALIASAAVPGIASAAYQPHPYEFMVDNPPYNAVGNGSTPDTIPIQNAITDAVNYAKANGGFARVILGNKQYMLDGMQVSSTLHRGQLLIPNSGPTQVVLEITGAGPAPLRIGEGGRTGTQLLTNFATANVGTSQAMITTNNGGGPTGFSNLIPIIKNLQLQLPSNPVLGGINIFKSQKARVEDVTIEARPGEGNAIIEPTNGSAVGLALPEFHNFAQITARGVAILGFHLGIRFGEHANLENCHVALCKIGMATTNSDFLMLFGQYVTMSHVPYVFAAHTYANATVAANQTRCFPNIHGLNVEDRMDPHWTSRVTSFWDTGQAKGNVTYLCQQAGTGTKQDLLNIGATNITFDRLDNKTPNL